MQTKESMTKKDTNKAADSSRATIPWKTLLVLFVRAGGRCSICQQYLLQDSLTLREANLSNVAHIVAASPDGPRGDDPLSAKERNEVGNLMLVCPAHHKLIDSREYVSEWPVEKLRALKRDHEGRIRRLTGYEQDNKTTVLRFRANFNPQQAVDLIPKSQIEAAIAPRFMQDDHGIELDLTGLHFELSDAFWTSASAQIHRRLGGLYEPTLSQEPIRHLSVFALGPIPLLVDLGHCLSTTVPVDAYQRHMDEESWCWKIGGTTPTEFSVERTKDGEGTEVAALISVSGRIDHARLPEDAAGYPVYELTVAGQSPGRCLLNTRDDLARFRDAYQRLLGRISSDNPAVTGIHLIAAVPAPAAVICGRDLLRKVHPAVHVYEFDKATGKYVFALTVNNHEHN
jgi:hypothetical protein